MTDLIKKALSLFSSTPTVPLDNGLKGAIDNATQSNYNDISSTHINLDWTVDWKSQTISGSIHHIMTVHTNNITQAIFDSSYLSISRITNKDDKDLEFLIASRDSVMGNKLTVELSKILSKGDKVDVIIHYETTSGCTALGWLEAQQTDSGKYPFLYSQCQAIHCRSLCRKFETLSFSLCTLY